MNIKNIGRKNTVRTLVVGAGVLAAVAVVGCGTQSTARTSTGGAGSQTVGARRAEQHEHRHRFVHFGRFNLVRVDR